MPSQPTILSDLITLFGRSTDRSPDKIAIRDDERSLSYLEVEARSCALAAILSARGVSRGDRVALCVPRGVDVLVAMLGILRTGAAYVAIDPRLPVQRCSLMVKASGAKVVLIDGNRHFPSADGVDFVHWRSAPASGRQDLTPPAPVIGADLACVMFTSGSSGAPKAIMVEHRNLVALATNRTLPELVVDDVFGQVASLSFDTFHIETWATVAVGASVAVLPTMPELINGDVHRELRRRRISVLLAPTMAVNHIVHEDREAFSSLRLLQTGGDVLQPSACAALLSGGFGGQLWNLYGPTEATTASTCHQVTLADSTALAIPIGRVLVGENVLVLDSSLAPVIEGAEGELFIGGNGVTRGYLSAPARTAEQFLPHPGGAGERMYRTGDRVRQRPDGVVEFLGRIDEQVKIRGYRVEPRESEYAVGQHTAVRDVAMLVVGDAHDKRLVALIVLAEDITPARLRQDLAELLPDYLLPSAFIVLNEIPSTDHGKRDMDHLRLLAEEHMHRAIHRKPPEDEVESYLVDMWEQLLRVESIGRDDNFFALGGNSLLAFRARRRIARDLGISVGVPEILEAGELRALASIIRERQASATEGLAHPTPVGVR